MTSSYSHKFYRLPAFLLLVMACFLNVAITQPAASVENNDAPAAVLMKEVVAIPDDQGVSLKIKADGSIQIHKNFVMKKPPRIVFDFPGLKSAGPKGKRLPVRSDIVSQVRYYEHPDYLRVVLEVSEAYLSNFQAVPVEDGFSIRVGPSRKSSGAAGQPTVKEARKPGTGQKPATPTGPKPESEITPVTPVRIPATEASSILNVKKRPEKIQEAGKIQWVNGDAKVQPVNQSFSYRARSGLSVFPGDTLSTGEGARMQLEMNDGSIMTLTSNTRIVINISVYDPNAKKRVSLFDMVSGKARFMVKKLADYRHSQFHVQTKSSVVGIRGSDFIIEILTGTGEAIERHITLVTTLENTIIEVWDPANPEQRVVMDSYQALVAELGALGEPDDVTLEEIEKELDDFKYREEEDEEGEGDGEEADDEEEEEEEGGEEDGEGDGGDDVDGEGGEDGGDDFNDIDLLDGSFYDDDGPFSY